MHVKWVALVDHDKLGERDEDDVDQEIGWNDSDIDTSKLLYDQKSTNV